jgi:hypothetical protein
MPAPSVLSDQAVGGSSRLGASDPTAQFVLPPAGLDKQKEYVSNKVAIDREVVLRYEACRSAQHQSL